MYPLSAALLIADGRLAQTVQACLRRAHSRVVLQAGEVARWSELLLQLERAQPDVVITDFQPRLDDAIRRIRTVLLSPVIVVHDAVDAETILAVIRSGAREYVYPPYEPGLLQALERIGRERADQEGAKGATGQIVGILSAKGGCGATTIACHIAAEMRRLTKKEILLADLDLSSGVVAFLMNAHSPYSILDAASNLHRLDLSYWKGLVFNGNPRLEVISAPGGAALRSSPKPESFREVLRFARAHYDWILADLGRGLSYFTMSLVEDLDHLLLVSHAEVPALYQAKNMVQALRHAGFGEERMRLLVNRAPRDSDFSIQEVERLIGLPIQWRLPNSYPELYRAFAEGRLLAPETPLGKQFTRLAQALMGVPHEGKPGRAMPVLGVKKVAPGWEGV
jgi:pilus assembly protein CpaE